MKELGFGMLRLPFDDMEQIFDMVDKFMQQGFNYFDTAYVYERSEDTVRQALVERYPRESYMLADKLPLMILANKSEEDQANIFDESLSRCGVAYFDYYLLHNLNESNYQIAKRLNSFDFIRKKKEEGKIRRYGFSYHGTAEFLDRLLTELPDMEFVQLQINYLDWDDERVQSRKCYEVAVRHGKPVIVMEPVKGGNLANIPERARSLMHEVHPDWSAPSWAIRFAASLENVERVLSGMSTTEQVQDNTLCMTKIIPLNQQELSVLERVAEILIAEPVIACTGCRYCLLKCPKQMPIPELFALYNQDRRLRREGNEPRYDLYQKVTESTARATECVSCRLCESVCPQSLKICHRLKRIAEIYEKNRAGD